MDDSEFNTLADMALKRIETFLDENDVDLDYAMVSAGVLEIECADRSKIIVNRHAAAQEMWVAAKSGGFHFRWDGAAWRDTRTSDTLPAVLSRLLFSQAGICLDLS